VEQHHYVSKVGWGYLSRPWADHPSGWTADHHRGYYDGYWTNRRGYRVRDRRDRNWVLFPTSSFFPVVLTPLL